MAIGKLKKEGEFKAGDLVGFRRAALEWVGADSSDTDMSKLRKLETPSKAKRLTIPNFAMFCVLLENGLTIGYACYVGFYVLNSPLPMTDMSKPIVFTELGQWVDISMGPHWLTYAADGSDYSKPVILRSTEKYLAAPKIIGGDQIVQFTYNAAGNGVSIAEYDSYHETTSVTESFTLGTGITIKKGVNDGGSRDEYTFYTSDGFYRRYMLDEQLYKVPFPYGTIKNAWVTHPREIFAQNTSNVVYCSKLGSASSELDNPSNLWSACGEWDVKKITGVGQGACIMLTNDGKLYYRGFVDDATGLPFTNNFIRIYSDWLFDDVEYDPGIAGMGIIKSAA